MDIVGEKEVTVTFLWCCRLKENKIRIFTRKNAFADLRQTSP
jgi:hypothetical protein